MKIGLVVLAALGAVCSGCATPPEQQPAALAPAAAAAATTTAPATAPTRMRSRATITGSRLPPVDDDDIGTNAVSAVSKEDYLRADDARMKPKRGEGGF